jgi:hypothetical protein
MEDCVEQWTSKVHTIHPPLVIQILELFNKLNENPMGFLDLCACYPPLHDNSDSACKLAEVLPILVGQ